MGLASIKSLENLNSTLLPHLQKVLWQDQRSDGHWHYPLDDSITMNAEYIMFLRWMDENDENLIERLANFIVKTQQPDGSWNIYFDGPPNLDATTEAYFALRLAGYRLEDSRLKKAAEVIRSHGGIPKARVFTKIWLALFGLYSWKGIPIIPPEIMLSPRGTPFNIYEFSYWSRSVIIPLTILFDVKKVKNTEFDLDELYLKAEDKNDLSFIDPLPVDNSWYLRKKLWNWKWLNWEQVFSSLNHGVNFYEKKVATKPLRKQALQKARQWILEHQDEAGDWGGIMPAMMNSTMALYASGMSKDDAPVTKGMNALREICRGLSQNIQTHLHENESTATLQSCVSPVWDTALSALALIEAGTKPQDARLEKTKKWLWDHRITKPSDWKYKSKLNLRESFAAWCFQYYNDYFPDLDDSTIATLTLFKLGMNREELQPALRWIYGMQNSDGGWGTFDRDCNQWILNEIPFADLKSLIDPSNADCTGHILETLGEIGEARSRPIKRAIAYLKKTQRPNGSWFGRWGVHTIYGTWSAVVGLRKVGEPVEAPYLQRALRFILACQNEDGGWGESCDNYRPNVETGRGKSTPSQTAWALLSLESCRTEKEDFDKPIQKGIRFLESRIDADGLEEREFTGTGFPMHFYLRYDGYRKYFPLMALGRLHQHKIQK